MIRRASELDSGSRVVIDGAIRTVVTIHDLPANSFGAFVSILLDNRGAIIERASALYTCV